MKVKSFFALVGVVAIPVTIILVSGRNPLPDLLDRVASARTLSDPPTAWRATVDTAPKWASAAGSSAVVVGGDGFVSVLDAGNGDLRWTQRADSAAVAGTSGEVVVVLGADKDRHTVQARDTRSGAVLWDQPKVLGYWTFTDLVITLTCPDSDECVLTARSPRSPTEVWHASLPAGGRGLTGANHPLAGLRSLLTTQVAAVPAVLGFPIDDKVRVLDAHTGKLLQTETVTNQTRYLAAGTGVLRIDAKYGNDGCRYTLRWTNLTGKGSWHADSFQPRTSDGAVCEQRGDPVADEGLLYVIGPGRADSVLDLRTGAVVYSTAENERIVAVGAPVDGRATVALVRTAKKDAVSARSLADGKEQWRQPIGKATTIGTDGAVASFVLPDAGTLTARRLGGGAVVIQATSLATLLGYTPDGLVLNETLRVGLLRYGAVHP